MRDILRKIIELTADINKDGSVWGKDTELGDIDDLIEDALSFLKSRMKRTALPNNKEIYYLAVDELE